ncbi:MAG: FixH family protein [Gemmatimonadaceae bacterium]|nr:FixH family protein [Gemmatimonadaceae bacterium]
MKAGMGWPIGIAVVLGATVVANIVVMNIANGDAAFAIEPDYYKKAVAFDSTMATEQRSIALGWSAVSTLIAGDSVGRPVLTVTILDAQRQPVSGATVNVAAMANARANNILTARLVEAAPGIYRHTLPAQFAGQWEVRVDAVRGNEHFVSSTRTDLARTTVAPTGTTPAQASAPSGSEAP